MSEFQLSKERLPPLKALRAFEMAARLESFNRAAEALHVTPSAISHQVKRLEEFVGVRLFRRLGRQVELTPQGKRYLPAVRDAFEQIRLATEALTRGQSSSITISAAPSFAVGWLISRLPQFQLTHPHIEVRLISSIEVVDFARSDVDAGIRTGRGDWPGLRSHRLMAEELVVVCRPELIAAENGLRQPSDLMHVTLLHELSRLGQWRSWLSAVGIQGVDAERGPKFQGASMAVEAALAGLGVAIANRRLVEAHVAQGRLVIPFDIELPSESAYYLVYPEEREADARIAAFRDWLLATIAAEEAETPVA